MSKKKKSKKKDGFGTVVLCVLGVVIIIAGIYVIVSSVKDKDSAKTVAMPDASTTSAQNNISNMMGGNYDSVYDFMDTFDELAEGNYGVEGEYDPDVSDEYMAKIDGVKAELSHIDNSYTAEQAAADGFVVVKSDEYANIEKVREFYDATKSGNEAQINIIYCNESGGNVLRGVRYDGKRYYGVVDMTDYEYSTDDYLEFEYPCCELFEEVSPDGTQTYYALYLTDSEGYTFDEIMNLNASMLASDWEKFLSVCEYVI